MAVLFAAGVYPSKAQKINSDVRKIKPWTIGIGINAIDDSVNDLQQLSNIKQSWKIMPLPSKLNVERYLAKGISLGIDAAANKYDAIRKIEEKKQDVFISFTTANIYGKYDLNEIIGNTQWVDPYVSAGLGLSVRDLEFTEKITSESFFTRNLGLGINLWITEKCGINLESTGKFSFSGVNTSYKHHAIGLVYQLGTK